MIPERVQHPITDFTGPWDDFMVHGLHSPLAGQDLHIEILLQEWQIRIRGGAYRHRGLEW